MEEEWHLTRKHFIRSLVLSGVALQLPWLNACVTNNGLPEDVSPLQPEQFKNVQAIQGTLFPDDGNGPGALQVNSDKYLLWILKDELLDPDDNQFIIEKLDLFTSRCVEFYNKEFYYLSDNERTVFIKTITSESWGDRWISIMLTLIFEALLLDPIYGGNPNEIGWQWLEHNPGTPRPTDRLKYPEILKIGHEV